MPIYAYRCESCGFAKDVLQKISDPLLTDCPACGQASFQKQVTAAGFQLKGSGWYVTDFRDGNNSKPAAGNAAPAEPAHATAATDAASAAPAATAASTSAPAVTQPPASASTHPSVTPAPAAAAPSASAA